jgi:tripartite-type tricarboxylate transporter receptor subunit TctC
MKAMETPEIKERFLALGGDPEAGTPEELRVYMTNESAKWAKIIKAANIRIE